MVNRFGLMASDQPGCMPLPYQAMDHTATEFPSGHVVVVGTSHLEADASQVGFLLDPMTARADPLPTVPSLHRVAHSATVLYDGRLAVLGGIGTGGPAPRDIVVLRGAAPMLSDYMPTTDYRAGLSFVQIDAELAAVRRTHNAARFHGTQILVNDGSSQAEMFLGQEERSELIQVVGGADPFPDSQGRPVSVVPLDEGRAVILGGLADHVGLVTVESGNRTVSFDRFNAQVGQRSNPVGLKLPDGRAMFLGGMSGVMSPESPVVIVSPSGRTVTEVELDDNARFPQRGFTANVFPSGYVLVVGGDSQSGRFEPGSTFILEPVDGPPGGYHVFEGPRLILPRTGHTTSVLADGRILVIGGRSADGVTSSSQTASSAEVVTF
jgi:hypothetical protein